jgi:hypothetical protein
VAGAEASQGILLQSPPLVKLLVAWIVRDLIQNISSLVVL